MIRQITLAAFLVISSYTYTMEEEQPHSSQEGIEEPLNALNRHSNTSVSPRTWHDLQRLITLLDQPQTQTIDPQDRYEYEPSSAPLGGINYARMVEVNAHRMTQTRTVGKAALLASLAKQEEEGLAAALHTALNQGIKTAKVGKELLSLRTLSLITVAQLFKNEQLNILPEDLKQLLITFKSSLAQWKSRRCIDINCTREIDGDRLEPAIIEALIAFASVDERKALIDTLREQAAYHARISALAFFIERGIDCTTSCTQFGDLPLHRVCSSPLIAEDKAIKAIDLLLNHRTDINAEGEQKATALHLAAKAGRINIVKYLLEHGAQVNVQDKDKNTPLHYVFGFHTRAKHIDVVKCLLEHGADITLKNKNGFIPLELAKGKRGLLILTLIPAREIAILLEKQSKLLQQTHVEKQTEFEEQFLNAAETGNSEAVKRFLEEGVSINCKDAQGNTALMLAARAGRTEMVLYLLSQQADISLTNAFGETAADLARQTGQHHSAFIIENGIN